MVRQLSKTVSLPQLSNKVSISKRTSVQNKAFNGTENTIFKKTDTDEYEIMRLYNNRDEQAKENGHIDTLFKSEFYIKHCIQGIK
jgi:hypothetical protein